MSPVFYWNEVELLERLTKEKTCKEVELLERTQQRIKLKQLKEIVYDVGDHLCVTHSCKERKEGESKEWDKEQPIPFQQEKFNISN
jgi:regulator of replication initiation timing